MRLAGCDGSGSGSSTQPPVENSNNGFLIPLLINFEGVLRNRGPGSSVVSFKFNLTTDSEYSCG